MHRDRNNLFERDDVYCAPVPTETTGKCQLYLWLFESV